MDGLLCPFKPCQDKDCRNNMKGLSYLRTLLDGFDRTEDARELQSREFGPDEIKVSGTLN